MFYWLNKTLEWDNAQFAGFQIGTSKTGFQIHQEPYLSKLKELSVEDAYSEFRYLGTKLKLAWLISGHWKILWKATNMSILNQSSKSYAT